MVFTRSYSGLTVSLDLYLTPRPVRSEVHWEWMHIIIASKRLYRGASGAEYYALYIYSTPDFAKSKYMNVIVDITLFFKANNSIAPQVFTPLPDGREEDKGKIGVETRLCIQMSMRRMSWSIRKAD